MSRSIFAGTQLPRAFLVMARSAATRQSILSLAARFAHRLVVLAPSLLLSFSVAAATPEPIFMAGAPEPSDAGTIVTPDAVSVTGFAWPAA